MSNLNTNTWPSNYFFGKKNTPNRRLESSECPVPVSNITDNVDLSKMKTTTCLTDGDGHNATSFKALPANLQQKICAYPVCKDESTKSVNVTSAIFNATGNYRFTINTPNESATTVRIAGTGENYKVIANNNETLAEKDGDIIKIRDTFLKNIIGIDIKSETNETVMFNQVQDCVETSLPKSENHIIFNLSESYDPQISLLFGNVMTGYLASNITVQGNPGNNKTEEIRIDTNDQLPLTYNKECLQNNGTRAPSLKPSEKPISAAPSRQQSSAPSAVPSSFRTFSPTGEPSNIVIEHSNSNPSENIANSIIGVVCILLLSLAIFKGSRKVRFMLNGKN